MEFLSSLGHGDRASLCEALGFAPTDGENGLEAWLTKHPVRDRFKIFLHDCHQEGEPPLDDAVILMSVQVILDESCEFRDVLTKETKVELRWQKVSHYIWFVTGLVTSQKGRGGIWRSSGDGPEDLKKLCGIALQVLVSIQIPV